MQKFSLFINQEMSSSSPVAYCTIWENMNMKNYAGEHIIIILFLSCEVIRRNASKLNEVEK